MITLPIAITLLIFSTLVLWLGAELLVRHAVRISTSLAVPTSVIGITLIAAGTSLPELATNVVARLQNAPSALTFGSTIGSNIANIALILGSCILLFPIQVHRAQKKQMGLLLLVTTFFGLLMTRKTLGFFEGALLLILGLLALLQPWFSARKNRKQIPENKKQERTRLSWFFVALGTLCVIGGASGFVEGALVFAKKMGLSYHFVAITIIALGTSLPEWVTSLVAGFRKDHSFVISQIVGSNLFNILTINGIAAMIRPLEIGRANFLRDWSVMLVVTLALWLFGRKKPLPKSLGLGLILIYIFYIGISA